MTNGSEVGPDVRYDLSRKILPYLDKHMIIRIIDFQEEKQLYDKKEQNNIRDAIKNTFIYDDKIIEEAKKDCGQLGELTSMEKVEEFTGGVPQNQSIVSEKGITQENILNLTKYAKLLYESCNYTEASKILRIQSMLIDIKNTSTNSATNTNAIASSVPSETTNSTNTTINTTNNENVLPQLRWGHMACYIMSENYQEAYESARSLREMIDIAVKTPYTEQTQQRVWYMHWILFLIFVNPSYRSQLLDIQGVNPHPTNTHGQNSNILSERFLNAIQNEAPHLLRYLCIVAVQSVLNTTIQKINRSNISNIVRILSQDETLTSYKEPTTLLIKALLIDFDFQKAIECQYECRKVFQTDFFLQSKTIERQFFEASRVLFINTYSRINTEGDLNSIDAIFKQFGCDDSIPVSQIVASVQKNTSSTYSPTLIHAQTRYRAQSIVCRSNAILDNINKVN